MQDATIIWSGSGEHTSQIRCRGPASFHSCLSHCSFYSAARSAYVLEFVFLSTLHCYSK